MFSSLTFYSVIFGLCYLSDAIHTNINWNKKVNTFFTHFIKVTLTAIIKTIIYVIISALKYITSSHHSAKILQLNPGQLTIETGYRDTIMVWFSVRGGNMFKDSKLDMAMEMNTDMDMDRHRCNAIIYCKGGGWFHGCGNW